MVAAPSTGPLKKRKRAVDWSIQTCWRAVCSGTPRLPPTLSVTVPSIQMVTQVEALVSIFCRMASELLSMLKSWSGAVDVGSILILSV